MKISDIYTKYKTPVQLRTHQLRVAAVAKIICDHIPDFLEPDRVVKVCLIHDMGNIIKFDLDKFPEFLQPEGREYWQNAKDAFINKYGNDEHLASLAIADELGVPENIKGMIQRFNLTRAVENAHDPDLGIKISVYSDFRVTPHSITSLQERLDESYQRNKDNPKRIQSDPEKFKVLTDALFSIEQELFSNNSFKPEQINIDTVEIEIPRLLEMEI